MRRRARKDEEEDEEKDKDDVEVNGEDIKHVHDDNDTSKKE